MRTTGKNLISEFNQYRNNILEQYDPNMNFLGLESAKTGKQQLSEEVLHVLAKLDCQSVKTAADYVCSNINNGIPVNTH